jgi:hypothetical protein
VDERRFFSLIAAADVVVNLRHPVAGETSGTMVRALGGGACVVMVDRGPFAEIPSDAAVHVAWGPDVEQRLGARLVELAQNGASRRRIGEAARAFIAANNRLDQTIGGYLGALDRARTHAPPRWASETVFEFLPPHRLSEAVAAARAALGRRHLPLWFEAGAVPVCDGRQPRTLVLGVDDAGLLARLGYKLDAERVPRFGARTADARDARSVDLAIILPDAALPEDPGETLAWLNRRLAFGGILVWSLASGGDAAAEPLRTQRSAMRLFEAYGFRVEATFAGSPPFIDDAPAPAPDDDATDERCWRLRKVSETFASRDLRPLEPLQVHR